MALPGGQVYSSRGTSNPQPAPALCGKSPPPSSSENVTPSQLKSTFSPSGRRTSPHLGSAPALREPPKVSRQPKILPRDLKVCLQEAKNAPPEAQNRPFEGLRRSKSTKKSTYEIVKIRHTQSPPVIPYMNCILRHVDSGRRTWALALSNFRGM